MRKRWLRMDAFAIGALLSLLGCSAAGSGGDGDSGTGNKGSGSSGGTGPILSGAGSLGLGGDIPTEIPEGDGNPETCAEAAMDHTYVGCDFWPTIVANPVWKEFDPAVVVANGQEVEVAITVDGPAGFHQEVTVPAGGLQTVLLKWVDELKGPEFSIANTSGGRLENSVRVDGGAYHVTSSLPVTAWQFNPLQYTKEAADCARITNGASGCRAASNDASLLLPSTAMTNNYRAFTYAAMNEGKNWGTVPGGLAITATAASTLVKVQLGPKCGYELSGVPELGTCVAASAGGDIPAKNAGEIYEFTMNAGDVVQLVGSWSQYELVKNADLSGSVVNASAPVQVIGFNAISQLPDYSVTNADHMEETILPAEVIGKKYIVVPPTNPQGISVGHVVRIYGNVDGTTLSYPEGKPAGAPDVINAGETYQVPPLPPGQAACLTNTAYDNCMTKEPFIVEGSQPFAVLSFMVGGTLQIPGTTPETSEGDPSMTMEVTPEQFRKDYTFLAPTDYKSNFADILVPEGATVTLDGAPLTAPLTKIGNSEWSFARAPLDSANGGTHKLHTDDPRGLGLQVMGFGFATAYYYPGGLNLLRISEPPVIVVK